MTARHRLSPPADISKFPEAVYDQLNRIEGKIDQLDQKVDSRFNDLEDDLRRGFDKIKGMIDR